ncbi:NB-ARC domain-containing protein [Streptomyces sp. NPDC054945]
MPVLSARDGSSRSSEGNVPLTPSAALHGFLTALGHPAATLPKETHELSAMYRTALAGRRMLILLDNAQSADQVRPLLPNSPGSVTVVTSRSRLAGLTIREGAVRIDLDCLLAAASVHLLAKVIGTNRVHAEPEAAAAVVSLCGDLPLALHITAERLARHPGNPLSEWVDMMTRDAGGPLEHLDIPGDPTTSLRTVFSWSYLALPAATSQLFRHLGLGDESEFEAAQVTHACADGQPVEAHLDILVDSSLLTSPIPGRYRLHKLVHLYARERAEAEEGPEYLVDFARRLRRSPRVVAGAHGRPPQFPFDAADLRRRPSSERVRRARRHRGCSGTLPCPRAHLAGLARLPPGPVGLRLPGVGTEGDQGYGT